MSIKIKLFLLVACLAIISLVGFGMLLRNSLSQLESLKTATEENVQALVAREAQAVSGEMRLMAEKALDYAQVGETFLRLQKDNSPTLEAQIQDHLTRAIAEFPAAIGGGIWYEPNVFFPDRQYYGPYAYRGEGGKITFTMEYNTKEYDYHTQAWYATAIPKNWDRKRRRDQRIFWSDPYVDEAGTKALMITVGGVMYGPGGEIVGMSSFDLSLEHLGQRMAAIKPTPSSKAFAVDKRSGLVIASPAAPELRMQPLARTPWAASVDTTLAPGRIAAADMELNRDAHTLFHTITDNGMILGVLVPHREFYATANALNQRNQYTAGAVAFALLLLLALNGTLLHRMVIRPLGALSRFAQAIGAGNLDAPLVGQFSAEMGALKDAMTGMVSALKEKIQHATDSAAKAQQAAVLAQEAQREAEAARVAAIEARQEGMRMAAESLEAITEEIRAATDQVEHRARDIKDGSLLQRQRIESTAIAMNEMTASILEIASSAAAAATSAGASREKALTGADAVGATLDSMHSLKTRAESLREGMARLGDRAQSIGAIMNVIQDIADQTNLLALNAAIEAARAGEAGRGFAVVADEVRKLAEKTMHATREVGESIGSIQQLTGQNISAVEAAVAQIAEAAGLSGKSGELLRDVVGNADEAAGQVQGIAAASQEQSSASEEVNASVEEINAIARRTTEGVEESTQAIGALAVQVRALHGLIQEFRAGAR